MKTSFKDLTQSFVQFEELEIHGKIYKTFKIEISSPATDLYYRWYSEIGMVRSYIIDSSEVYDENSNNTGEIFVYTETVEYIGSEPIDVDTLNPSKLFFPRQ